MKNVPRCLVGPFRNALRVALADVFGGAGNQVQLERDGNSSIVEDERCSHSRPTRPSGLTGCWTPFHKRSWSMPQQCHGRSFGRCIRSPLGGVGGCDLLWPRPYNLWPGRLWPPALVWPNLGQLARFFWSCFGRSGPQMCLFSPWGWKVEHHHREELFVHMSTEHR